eukprot:COSAG06_NODE_1204_length_10277_cov_21.330517_12_plen_31_part_01
MVLHNMILKTLRLLYTVVLWSSCSACVAFST